MPTDLDNFLDTVKTRIKEPRFLGSGWQRFLYCNHLTGHFVQTLGRGRGYVINLWSEITSGSSTIWQRAIFTSQNQFYSKWVVKFQAGGS